MVVYHAANCYQGRWMFTTSFTPHTYLQTKRTCIHSINQMVTVCLYSNIILHSITNTLISPRNMSCSVSPQDSVMPTVSLAQLHHLSLHPTPSGPALTSILGPHHPTSAQGPWLVRHRNHSFQFSIACIPRTSPARAP